MSRVPVRVRDRRGCFPGKSSMIAIVDYGAGNLFSVRNALDFIGLENMVTDRAEDLEKADGIILPGVGAFPDAMDLLTKSGLIGTLRAQAEKKPLLGICLGMQMLFEKGYEFRETDGLGFIEGTVDHLPEAGLKIPHMGWNNLVFNEPCPLLDGIAEGSYVYFVHSYAVTTSMENIAAYTEYGCVVPALVQKGNVFGAQFHPEKSGDVGLQILRNFGKLVRETKEAADASAAQERGDINACQKDHSVSRCP